jgi:hypothetical protein
LSCTEDKGTEIISERDSIELCPLCQLNIINVHWVEYLYTYYDSDSGGECHSKYEKAENIKNGILYPNNPNVCQYVICNHCYNLTSGDSDVHVAAYKLLHFDYTSYVKSLQKEIQCFKNPLSHIKTIQNELVQSEKKEASMRKYFTGR